MRASFSTALILLLFGVAARVCAQQQVWEIEALSADGSVTYNLATGTAVGTNGVLVKYGNISLVADTVSVSKTTGETVADGRVRIQSDDMIWAGEHVRYNFNTRQMQAEQFRAGKSPVYAGGEGLAGDMTNKVYTATNGFITLDDYSEPLLQVRAKRLKIIPGERFEAHGATLCVGSVPVFYLPYYSQRVYATTAAFSVTPGYRSRFGPFILGSYAWRWNDAFENKLHLDYRGKRGPGAGADLLFHLGQWGEAVVKYYYLHDMHSETNDFGTPYPENRQRVEFSWLATPFTNTMFKSRVSYQTDAGMRREFFEGEYRRNVQPGTFLEARHFWDNFSLDVMAAPRVNDFYEAVERLPEVKLTAYRQQIGNLPLYYESESRAAYLRRRFAETNGPTGLDYEAARADTWHQVTLPQTFFGWFNVTPRAGGRFTYYSEAEGPGATTQEEHRAVFNTGVEASFKVSRLWAGAKNGFFNLDGIRHIMEPSANYVYVPRPDTLPDELPQFDYPLASLHVLPIEYPDYNAIDSVDSQNVIRWGLRNRLQTKRDGQVEDFLSLDLFADWRLEPGPGQTKFADLWADFSLRPRTWLTLDSQTRYDLDNGRVRLSFNSVTIQPDSMWSWRLGYFYLRDDFSTEPTAWGEGNNLVTSSVYLRLNENWGLRASHYYNIREHKVEQQVYSLYRDFRSWTGAVSFRARESSVGDNDYTVAFTFSIKAVPRFGLGDDTIRSDLVTGD